MIEFRLPSLGSDMDEGKLLEWRVKPGDAVRRGQVIAVVDTSKAAVDVEAWHEGTVFDLLAEPGETIPVGTPMATLLEPGEDAQSARHAERRPAPAPTPGTAAVAPPAAAPGGRRRISPAARKHAADRGIDIEKLAGTGPDGAVTLQDVERAAAGGAEQAAERQRGMRRAIAAAMSRSKREIPHYYLSETIPMREAQAWLAAANAQRPVTDRVLMAALLLKAVALSLTRHPDLNGFFQDGEFRPAPSVHAGVAIALRQGGLVAPALHGVEGKRLGELMRELAGLVQRARAGSLKSSEMSDPTVTVTNLGERGVDEVLGVIYPPQVALVGLGRIAMRPWVRDGGVCAEPLLVASLAADHRVTDGHYGARFLADLRERLQRPAELEEDDDGQAAHQG